MRRLAVGVVVAALLVGGAAWALEETISTDKNFNGKYIRNVSGLASGEVVHIASDGKLAGTARLTYVDTASTRLTIGDGAVSTTARLALNNTGTGTSGVVWEQTGTTYMTFFGSRDGTGGTGLVSSGITITPVSGGAGTDRWQVVNNAAPAGALIVYPRASLGDVALGAHEELATSDTTGFVWIPRMNGAPAATPALDGATAGPRTRQAMVYDRANNRLYIYDSLEATWHFTAINDGAAGGINQLTGDITAGPGTGSQAATIANDAVTLPKIVNFITDSFPCRDTAGTGDLEVCAVGGGIEFTGGPGIQRSALTGDVTASAGSNTTAIASNAVTDAKLRDSGALSLIGRNVNTTGDPADISASAGSDCVYREGSSTLACGQVATAGYANNSVSFAKVQQIATDRLVGRDTASTGNVEELTVTGGVEFTGAGGIQTSAFTGDATKAAGGTALTLATVNGNVGSFTNASITVNGKGLITAASSGATPAPVGATYITQTADGTLTNEQALGALATGLLKNTTTTGVLSIAVAGTDYETPITAGTGLTDSTNTFTANLSTGVSGGQTAIGGTGASEALTLSSTSNGTKGKVLLGNSKNFYNEAEPSSTSWFTIGNSSTAPPGTIAQFNRNTNAPAYMVISNPNTGTAAEGGIIVSQSATDYSGAYIYFALASTGFSTIGPYSPSAALYEHASPSTGPMIFSAYGPQPINFYTTTSRTLRMSIANNGNVSIASLNGGGMITSDTSGVLSEHPLVYYDVGDDQFVLDTEWAHYNTGTPGGSYERVRATWQSNVWTLASETSGGTVRPMTIDAGTALLSLAGGQVNICIDDTNCAASGFFSIQPSGQVLVDGDKAVASATSAVADSVTISSTAAVSGSTAITTAGGFNGVTLPSFSITSAANVTNAATLRVAGVPTISGGGAITNAYSAWFSGPVRLENGGGVLFEFPNDATAGADTTIDARIPVTIAGVGTRYIRVYAD